jgi:hypothetical protein
VSDPRPVGATTRRIALAGVSGMLWRRLAARRSAWWDPSTKIWTVPETVWQEVKVDADPREVRRVVVLTKPA